MIEKVLTKKILKNGHYRILQYINIEKDIKKNGAPVGRLRLRTFARPEALVREGAGRYQVPASAGPQKGRVQVHGATRERANTDVTRGLVEMIRLQRAYDMQLDAMKQRDSITRTTIAEVGQVGR